MNRKRLCIRIKRIWKVKTNHLTSIKIDNNTTRILHTNVENLIMVSRRDRDVFTNISSNQFIKTHLTCLSHYPSRVIKVSTIPILSSYRFPYLPICLQCKKYGKSTDDAQMVSIVRYFTSAVLTISNILYPSNYILVSINSLISSHISHKLL